MPPRHRRTFSYASSSSSSGRDIDDELDETQQEAVIATLRARDESSTNLYRSVLSILPLLIALFYLPSFLPASHHVSRAEGRRARLLALLGMSSLLATAWTMYALPLPGVRSDTSAEGRGMLAALMGPGKVEGPVAQWLPLMNGVLVVVMALFGFSVWDRAGAGEAVWAFVPAVVYVVVMGARRELRPVGVEGLERLRYTYRGA